MSAAAGREAGAVDGWASLPSLGHGVPPSGHGACTAPAAARRKERPGQEGWESCLIFELQNQTAFSIGQVLTVRVGIWQLGSSCCKKLAVGS